MLPFQTEKGKWNLRRFSSVRLSIAHRANGCYQFAIGLNRLAHLYG